MMTVNWKLADGTGGELHLAADAKWTFGRAGGDDVTVGIDHPSVSRNALTIRDSGPGPVLFRGQRENGARVALLSLLGSQRWIAEGTAANLSDVENRVEFSLGQDLILTVDVTFDTRGTVVERQQTSDPTPWESGR